MRRKKKDDEEKKTKEEEQEQERGWRDGVFRIILLSVCFLSGVLLREE
jgi:hypothetical protein